MTLPATKPPASVPVTLLSGFLGAGKTTLLRNILENKEGRKVAVIVNDMAAINIDAALIRETKLLQKEEKLVQLQNGCICCTLRGDLIEGVLQVLEDSEEIDCVVIESTGIADPANSASAFTFRRGPEGGADGDIPDAEEAKIEALAARLSTRAHLDTCVTVIDVTAFKSDLESFEDLDERWQDVDEEDVRAVSELLVSQVEFADVVVLNKASEVPSSVLSQQVETVRALNPTARVLTADFARVPVGEVVGTGRFDWDKARMGAGWLKALERRAAHGHSDSDDDHEPTPLAGPEGGVGGFVRQCHGLGSFVWQCRRPLHPGRLKDMLTSCFLLRVAQLDEEHDHGHDHDHDYDHGAHGEAGCGHSKGECESLGQGCEGRDEEQEEHRRRLAEKRDRALAAIRERWGGMVRSKGFLWVGGLNSHMVEVSHAGAMATLEVSGPWMSHVGIDALAELEGDARVQIEKGWSRAALPGVPEVGDRRQEVVFIGQGLQCDRIVADWEACLMTDEEMARADEVEDPLFEETKAALRDMEAEAQE